MGFLTQPWHHINAAWVAMLSFSILFAVSVLDEKAVRADIDWNFLISFGTLISFGNVISGSGLSEIIAITVKHYAGGHSRKGESWKSLKKELCIK